MNNINTTVMTLSICSSQMSDDSSACKQLYLRCIQFNREELKSIFKFTRPNLTRSVVLWRVCGSYLTAREVKF